MTESEIVTLQTRITKIEDRMDQMTVDMVETLGNLKMAINRLNRVVI